MLLPVVFSDALVVPVFDFLGNTLHAEDLDTEILTVRERILDLVQLLFVYLIEMDGETWRIGQPL